MGHFRRYGKQLREYLENAWGISSVVAPAFFTWVGIFRGYGKQLREYVVNMGEMCQHHGACFSGFGWDIFVGTGHNEENISRMRGECAGVVAPVF